jgi:glycosyltransferase involved in cell wall biosynthesis
MIHHIDNNMLINIFSHAHYLVLPYRDGTQSGPLMIAYNHNLPVIASNIDSFKELVHDGITGSLYDRTKKKGLEEILEAAILRNKADYTELLKRQKAHVEISYSTKEIAGLYKSMFNSIK